MISIIIPTLNEENYLPLLLESIKKQKFSEGDEDKSSSSPSLLSNKSSVYEVIVADADSKDRTREIARDFGCQVIKGGRPAKGRNEGAKIAKGDLFLFLDADVIIPKNFLTKSLEEFQKRKLDIASYCLIPQADSIFLKFVFNFFYNWPIVFLRNVLPHTAMGILVKREIFEKVDGGFDEEIKLAEDMHFGRQAAKFGKFGIIKSVNVFVSLRRFRKDGWLKTYFKYILCEFHMVFKGPVKKEVFRYEFDHYLKK
jgi:glycosyltransferase involved in cell wall biosynthesis